MGARFLDISIRLSYTFAAICTESSTLARDKDWSPRQAFVPGPSQPNISRSKYIEKRVTHFVFRNMKWVESIRVYRWMAWLKVPKKDVVTCEKLREGGKQPLIRRYPNGETRSGECLSVVR